MGSTRPMWVGLGWVEFFLAYHGGLGQKISSTQPNPTHAHPYLHAISKFFKVRNYLKHIFESQYHIN